MSSSAEMVVPTDPSAKSPFVNPLGREPLRDELFGQAYLEAYARELAGASTHSLTYPALPILDRLRDDDLYLHKAHAGIRDASRESETLTPDAEWLLDNFFVVEDVLREVKNDLPAGYYSELPRLTAGLMAGYPRILAMALGLISHTDSSLNEQQIREFVKAYQSVAPLTIGELWAFPTMLRLGLIENLRRLAEQMTTAREDREYATKWVSDQVAGGSLGVPERQSDPALVGILQGLRDLGNSAQPIVAWLESWLDENKLNSTNLMRREHRRQAANQVSVGNCIISLRLLNALDWNDFVEHTGLVEIELRSDPTGIYSRQDFQTRDRCRRAVEQLARGSKLTEPEVARKVVTLAIAGSDERRKQVAFYLIDRGRVELEKALGYRPTFNDRKQAFLRDHPAIAYFGIAGTLWVLILGLLVWASGIYWMPSWAVIVAFLGALPASELAIALTNFFVLRRVAATVQPKLEFRHGIPEGCGTFVVMPSMLTKPESATGLLERLELHYLANPDSQLRFALLTDFADAPNETMPEDASCIKAALEGVAHLNQKYACGGQAIFFVFHRKRQWNESEGKWMGWERKRGKLLEFNRILRGAADTSYAWTSGAPDQDIRYVLTLDTDTNLPRETARR